MSASILVVEDNSDNMKLISWVMEDEGYALTCVESAEEALEVLDKEPFDLVLMDISLPGMDGKEATRRLRAKPEFDSLPILAVTAHAITGDVEQILASGVSAMITKPIDEDQLLQTVKSFLSHKVHHG